MSIQFRTRTRGISVPTEDIFGACCYNVEGDVNNCTDNVSLRTCIDTNGIFLGAGSKCAGDPCNTGSRLGSCCINGFCYELDELSCNNRGGIYSSSINCIDRNCCSLDSPDFPSNNSTASQSCCFDNGSCLFLSPCDCVKRGGVNGGPGSNCATPCAEQGQFRGSCCVKGHCVGPMGDLTGDPQGWIREGYTAGDCRDIFSGIFGGSGTTCGGQETNGNNDIAGVTWPCVFPKGSCCFGNAPFIGDGIDPGKNGDIYCDGGRTAGHTAGTCLGVSGGKAFAPFRTCVEIEDGGGSWNASDIKICDDPSDSFCTRCSAPDPLEELGRCCVPNVYESFDFDGNGLPDYTFISEYSCLDDVMEEICEKSLEGLWVPYFCDTQECEEQGTYGENLRCQDDDFVCCEYYDGKKDEVQDFGELDLSCDIPTGSCCSFDLFGIYINCFDPLTVIDCENLLDSADVGSVSFRENVECADYGENVCDNTPSGTVPVGDSCCRWSFNINSERWDYLGCEDIAEGDGCDAPNIYGTAKRANAPCTYGTTEPCAGLIIGSCTNINEQSCRNTWEGACVLDGDTFHAGKECNFYAPSLPYAFAVDQVRSTCTKYKTEGRFPGSPLTTHIIDQQDVNFYIPPMRGSDGKIYKDGVEIIDDYVDSIFASYGVVFGEGNLTSTLEDFVSNGGMSEAIPTETGAATRSRNTWCFGDQVVGYRTPEEMNLQNARLHTPIYDYTFRPWNNFAEAFTTRPFWLEPVSSSPSGGYNCSLEGACCHPNPGIPCSITTKEECEDNLGFYRGNGTSCIQCEVTEESLGCCCVAGNIGLDTGLDRTESECTALKNQFPDFNITWLGPGISCNYEGTQESTCNKYTGRCCCSDGTGVQVPEDGDENANLLNCMQISIYENIKYQTCTASDLTSPSGDPSLLRCEGQGTFEISKDCCDVYSSVWDADPQGGPLDDNTTCDNCMLASSDYGERGACCSGVGYCANPSDCFYPDQGSLFVGCSGRYEDEANDLRNGGWGGLNPDRQNPNGEYPVCYDELTQNECVNKTLYWRERGWDDVEFVWLGAKSKCKHTGAIGAITQWNGIGVPGLLVDENTFMSTDPDGVENHCSGCLFGWTCASSDTNDKLYCGGEDGFVTDGEGCYGINFGPVTNPGSRPQKFMGHVATWHAPTTLFNSFCDEEGIESGMCEISTSYFGDRWAQRFFYRTETCTPFPEGGIIPEGGPSETYGYPAYSSVQEDTIGDVKNCPFCNANVLTNDQIYNGPGDIAYSGPVRNTYFRFGFDYDNGREMCANLGKVGDGSANNDENYGCFGRCCVNGLCQRWPMRVCIEELGGTWKGCGLCPEDGEIDNVCQAEEETTGGEQRTGNPNYFYCIGNCDGDEIGNIDHAGPCCFGEFEYEKNYVCDNESCKGVDKCHELGGYVLRTDNYPTQINMSSWCYNFSCGDGLVSSNSGDVVGRQNNANVIRELKETGYSSSLRQPNKQNYSDPIDKNNYSICAGDGCNDTTYKTTDPIENYLCGCACCYPYADSALPACLDMQTREECENSGGICSGFYGQCEDGVLNCDIPSDRVGSNSAGTEMGDDSGEMRFSPPTDTVVYEPFITGFKAGSPNALSIPFIGFKNVFEVPVRGHEDILEPLTSIPNAIYYRVGCYTDGNDGTPSHYPSYDLPFPYDPTSYQYLVGAKHYTQPDGHCSGLEIGYLPAEDPFGDSDYTFLKNNIHELWLTKYYTSIPYDPTLSNTLEPTYTAQLHKNAVPNLRKLVMNPARYGNNRYGIAGTDENFWRQCELGSCMDPLVPLVSGQILSNDLKQWRGSLNELIATDAGQDNASEGIGYLEFNNYPSLNKLYLQNNKLYRLDLENMDDLRHLWIQNNEFGNISEWMEVNNIEKQDTFTLRFPYLQTFYAQNNNLQTIVPESNLYSLVSMDVSNNPRLGTVTLPFTPRLEYLNVSGCNLTSGIRLSAPNLRQLIAENVTTMTGGFVNTLSGEIGDNYNYFALEELSITNSIGLGGVKGEVNLSQYYNLTKINLRNNVSLTAVILPNPSNVYEGRTKQYLRQVDLSGTSLLSVSEFLRQDAFQNPEQYPEGHTLELTILDMRAEGASVATLNAINSTVQRWNDSGSGRSLVINYDYDNSIFLP